MVVNIPSGDNSLNDAFQIFLQKQQIVFCISMEMKNLVFCLQF